MEIDKNLLGQKMKAYRISEGLTQDELAERISLSAGHISVMERGEKLPAIDTLIKFCNCFHIGVDDLFDEYVEKVREIKEREDLSFLASEIIELPDETKQIAMKVMRVFVDEDKKRKK